MINIDKGYDFHGYKDLNKIYIPEEYNNPNYRYILNNDFITIITTNNCRTSYNTQYCTCHQYNYENNIVTQGYECNTSSGSTQLIPYVSITSDVNYNRGIKSIYYNDTIIYLVMFILGLLFALFLTKERSSY